MFFTIKASQELIDWLGIRLSTAIQGMTTVTFHGNAIDYCMSMARPLSWNRPSQSLTHHASKVSHVRQRSVYLTTGYRSRDIGKIGDPLFLLSCHFLSLQALLETKARSFEHQNMTGMCRSAQQCWSPPFILKYLVQYAKSRFVANPTLACP